MRTQNSFPVRRPLLTSNLHFGSGLFVILKILVSRPARSLTTYAHPLTHKSSFQLSLETESIVVATKLWCCFGFEHIWESHEQLDNFTKNVCFFTPQNIQRRSYHYLKQTSCCFEAALVGRYLSLRFQKILLCSTSSTKYLNES